MNQLALLPELEEAVESVERDTSTTFQDNLSLPVHRWFRYSAGFSEKVLAKKVARCVKLSKRQRQTVANAMLRPCVGAVDAFLAGLAASVERKVTRVTILPLFGSATNVSSIAEALVLVNDFPEDVTKLAFNRYEIRIEFSNDDYVEGSFLSKSDATLFLHQSGV